MRKLVIGICSLSIALVSCQSSQMAGVTDDVYANPTEEKRLATLAAAEKAKQRAEQNQKAENERLAQKAKDDANPYYKDPSFDKDDYYDYEYASRVRRFHNPLNGTGYYDNWYTNNYWYSGNPAFYGNSIYSSPTWGMMPGAQFNQFNNGWGLGVGVGNNGWGNNGWNNGWGNNGWNNGWGNTGWNNGWGNNGWNNGWGNNGWNNGWGNNGWGNNGWGNNGWGNNGWGNNGWGNNGWGNNGGWGYFNSFDQNSGYSHVGPRTSSAGGNSSRTSFAGMSVNEAESASRQFFNSVIAKQEATPKFSEEARPQRIRGTERNNTITNNEGVNSMSNGGASTTNGVSGGRNAQDGGLLNWTRNRIERADENTNSGTTISNNPSSTDNSNTTAPSRGNNRLNSGKISQTPATDWNTNTGTNRSIGGGSGGSNSGGGNSSPRGSGGGSGGSRPR